MTSPFRNVQTSPEVIRLAVMMHVRFPLSPRNVEDLLHERGIDISHETVRFWWNRFGPMFAGEIRRKRFGRPETMVTERLRPYGAALRELGAIGREETGRRLNNRAENSHLSFRRRERAMQRFRRMRSLQKFVAVHFSVHNHFNLERDLSQRQNFKENRTAALNAWRQLGVA